MAVQAPLQLALCQWAAAVEEAQKPLVVPHLELVEMVSVEVRLAALVDILTQR